MRLSLIVILGTLTIFSRGPAQGSVLGSVSKIVVFGDSLSDNGNAAFALGGTIPGDYAPNAFTDGGATTPSTAGPFGLWIDQFSALAGLPDPTPFLSSGGTNFAVASAQTGSANPQDIANQLTAFASVNKTGAPSNALYAIWGGANDIYNGTNSGTAAADNLYGNISTLALGGAKYFLWLNLPQLGNTPRGSGSSAALNAQSAAFDAEWAIDIAKLQGAGVAVIGVDINGLFNGILAHPGSFGFNNVTTPSQNTPGNPNLSLFWDTEHPTTSGDALVAQAAFTAANAPEPSSRTMILCGGIVTIWVLARRRRVTSQACNSFRAGTVLCE